MNMQQRLDQLAENGIEIKIVPFTNEGPSRPDITTLIIQPSTGTPLFVFDDGKGVEYRDTRFSLRNGSDYVTEDNSRYQLVVKELGEERAHELCHVGKVDSRWEYQESPEHNKHVPLEGRTILDLRSGAQYRFELPDIREIIGRANE